ncbi:MAG: hypothetical protein K940chlam9_01483 [Chlamydiae bacterium]|nr:hypothetical protein [Chlamydiota bacterium]
MGELIDDKPDPSLEIWREAEEASCGGRKPGGEEWVEGGSFREFGVEEKPAWAWTWIQVLMEKGVVVSGRCSRQVR